MSAAELSRRDKFLVQLVCSMSVFIVLMDSTIVNVALPSIRTDLDASLSGLQWIVDAYLVVVASLLIFSGSVADRVGRRRIFQLGLVIFGLGSLACGLAPTLNWLIAARVLQAVGGSMLNPVAMAILVNVFSEPRERARAIATWSAVSGISMAAGPVVGGLLVDAGSWRLVFLINVPFVLIAIVLARRYVPESRASRPRRLDPVGQILIVVALGGTVYALIEGPRHGWTSPEVLPILILGLLAMVALPWVESRRPEPLIDFRFFRSVPFSGAVVLAVAAFAAFHSFMFLATLYLQEGRNFSASQAGLCMVPVALTMIALPRLSARLMNAFGPRPSTVLAGLGFMIGPILIIMLMWDPSIGLMLAGFVLIAAGVGMVNAPIVVAAVSGMPQEQSGVAAAIASTSRQVGGAVGVAIVGGIVAHRATPPFDETLLKASVPAWMVVSFCGLVVIVAGIVSTTRWALETARLSSERFAVDEDADPPVAIAVIAQTD